MLFLGCLNMLQAQRPRFRPQVHEFAIQLGSMQYIPETGTSNFTPLNGLRYAYHIDQKQALRIGAFFRNSDFVNPPNISERYQPFIANQKSAEMRLGYMLKHHIYRLQLYAGFEAILRYAWIDEQFNQDVTGAPNKTNMLGYGASAFVGARMFANKHLSLGVEADIYAAFQERRENDPSIAILPHEGLFMKREIGANIVSVYLAYHFKRMRKSCTCGKPGT